MITLSKTPFRFRTPKAIHLVHPALRKDAFVNWSINQIDTNNNQVLTLGTNIADFLFNNTNTIIVHGVPDSLFNDTLDRLQQYKEDFKRLAPKLDRNVIFLDTTIRMVGEKAYFLPNKALYNGVLKSPGVYLDKPGLGLFKNCYFDAGTSNLKNKNYFNLVADASKETPLYLLDDTTQYIAVFGGDAQIRYGKMYKIRGTSATEVKEPKRPILFSFEEEIKERLAQQALEKEKKNNKKLETIKTSAQTK